MKKRLLSSGVFLCAAMGLCGVFQPARAQVIVEPYAARMDPDGSAAKPWGRLESALGQAESTSIFQPVPIRAVEIRGDRPVYGTNRIAQPVRITRGSGLPPVKLGATPVAATRFRAISYNARIGDPNPVKDGLASLERGRAITNYNWGDWDVFGFCEVWAHYDDTIRLLGAGDSKTITAFDTASLQHGGLVLHAKHDLNQRLRGIYTACVGEDCLADKGWVRGRLVKDDIGIWVYMTHTQADVSDQTVTWAANYAARAEQLNQLMADVAVNRLLPQFADDVFVLMGDFNVFGEYREPPGSPDQNEYSGMSLLLSGAVPTLDGIHGMDAARQVFPKNSDYTYSWENDLNSLYYFQGMKPEDSARLDYIIALNSHSGKVVVETTQYQVLVPRVQIDKDGYTTVDLSDHWPVSAEFNIIRTRN